MASTRKVPFRILRFKKFMATLLGNKMSLTGLVLLSIFIFIALAAPLLTPYDPQGTVVSGRLATPSWTVYLTSDLGYSQNSAFSNLGYVTEGGSQVTPSNVGTDSAEFTVTQAASQTTGGKIIIAKTLSYPFRGSPDKFVGSVVVTPSGTLPVGVDLYVERVGIEKWHMWAQSLTISTEWRPPTPGGKLDSLNPGFCEILDICESIYTAAEVIFVRGEYRYVLEIALPPGALTTTIRVREFSMYLLGNTWGLLGTDNIGRDIFTQLMHGARISLIVGLLATFIGVGLGLLVGLIAGYLGKAVDEVLMRFTDMMLVIPGLPLLIVLVAVLGSSLFNIIAVLGFLGWMGFARVVRSQVLSLRERPFIEAAKASGAGTGYITMRHILPNIVSLTYVNLALSVPGAIVSEAALSFLGLGDQTVVTWGQMLQNMREAGTSATNPLWWWAIPPGASIALLSLSFILLGYALDEMFNPRLRKRR